MLRHFFVFSVLVCASVSDIRSFEIPDICPALIALSSVFSKAPDFRAALLPAAVHLLSALFCALIKRDMPLGFGDIKLLCALGLVYGSEMLIRIWASAFLLGGVCACALILFSQKDRHRKEMPFAPCIAAAQLLAVLF